MVDKLKDAAMFLKAKITKDEIEAMMIEATSEDNWQTPTTLLHQIANAAYNHDDWKKMEEFLMDKFKSKKWKKILKSLSVVEFLLKNGPSGILYDLKSELYMYKGFETYSYTSEGIDRGQAIRQKAKLVVELLVNQEMLEEERAKASNIKEKMGLSSTYSNARYEGPSSKSTSYQGSGSSSYQGMGSDQSQEYGRSRKYGEEPTENTYASKIKGGINQMSDMIKTAYNKTNFNDFGGYIKDKVTTNKEGIKHREGLLEDDEHPYTKKDSKEEEVFASFTEYKPPPPSNAGTAGTTSGGLFKNLNVKGTGSPTKTTTSNIQKPVAKAPPSKQTTTSAVKVTASQPQSVDLFSFDEEPAAVQKQQPVQPQTDIFADFGNATSAPVNKAPVPVPVPPANNFIGANLMLAPQQPQQNAFNAGLLGPPQQTSVANPQSNVSSVGLYGNTQASKQGITNNKPEKKWLSTQETNLIDFSDMKGTSSNGSSTGPNISGTAPQQSTFQSPTMPVYQPGMMPGYNGMQYYPQMQQYPAASPQQFTVPASQYQQFQQFLQFQQQQQQQTLRH